MEINLHSQTFTINEKGELEYRGKVITIHNEFGYLSKEQKKDILITLINWANDKIEALNEGLY